jgi:chromosome partitioning protein
MIITLAGAKGGTGKSTLAVHLGAAWSKTRRVLVVDADPQGTALAWGEVRAATGLTSPAVMSVGDNVREAISELAPGFDVVIIDTAGAQGKRLTRALSVADLALMPCLPAGPDIWALAGSIETVKEVQESGLNDKLKAAIVLNGASKTRLSSEALAAVKELGLPILASLGRRTAIAEATTAGEGVTERAPHSPAAIEMQALCKAIDRFMKGPHAS